MSGPPSPPRAVSQSGASEVDATLRAALQALEEVCRQSDAVLEWKRSAVSGFEALRQGSHALLEQLHAVEADWLELGEHVSPHFAQLLHRALSESIAAGTDARLAVQDVHTHTWFVSYRFKERVRVAGSRVGVAASALLHASSRAFRAASASTTPAVLRSPVASASPSPAPAPRALAAATPPSRHAGTAGGGAGWAREQLSAVQLLAARLLRSAEGDEGAAVLAATLAGAMGGGPVGGMGCAVGAAACGILLRASVGLALEGADGSGPEWNSAVTCASALATVVSRDGCPPPTPPRVGAGGDAGQAGAEAEAEAGVREPDEAGLALAEMLESGDLAGAILAESIEARARLVRLCSPWFRRAGHGARDPAEESFRWALWAEERCADVPEGALTDAAVCFAHRVLGRLLLGVEAPDALSILAPWSSVATAGAGAGASAAGAGAASGGAFDATLRAAAAEALRALRAWGGAEWSARARSGDVLEQVCPALAARAGQDAGEVGRASAAVKAVAEDALGALSATRAGDALRLAAWKRAAAGLVLLGRASAANAEACADLGCLCDPGPHGGLPRSSALRGDLHSREALASPVARVCRGLLAAPAAWGGAPGAALLYASATHLRSLTGATNLGVLLVRAARGPGGDGEGEGGGAGEGDGDGDGERGGEGGGEEEEGGGGASLRQQLLRAGAACLRVAAQSGHASAFVPWGECLQWGLGVADAGPVPTEAAVWFERARRAGVAAAGTRQAALRIAAAAAAAPDPETLALALADAEWAWAAGGAADADAAWLLACLLLHVASAAAAAEAPRAADLVMRAAALGHPAAAFAAGCLLYGGAAGVARDRRAAQLQFVAAAKRGSAPALNALGILEHDLARERWNAALLRGESHARRTRLARAMLVPAAPLLCAAARAVAGPCPLPLAAADLWGSDSHGGAGAALAPSSARVLRWVHSRGHEALAARAARFAREAADGALHAAPISTVLVPSLAPLPRSVLADAVVNLAILLQETAQHLLFLAREAPPLQGPDPDRAADADGADSLSLERDAAALDDAAATLWEAADALGHAHAHAHTA